MTIKMDKIKNTLFTEKQLENLPLNYRLMAVMDTATIGELYDTASFSKSKKHYSNEYINYNSYKPISNLFFDAAKSDFTNE